MPDAYLDRRRFLKLNGYPIEVENGSHSDAWTRRGEHGNTWRGAPSRRERVRAREVNGVACLRSAEEADFLECLLSGAAHYASFDSDVWFSSGFGPEAGHTLGVVRADFSPLDHHGIGYVATGGTGAVYDLGLPFKWSAAWREDGGPGGWRWRHARWEGALAVTRYDDGSPSAFTPFISRDSATGALVLGPSVSVDELIVFPCWFPLDFIDAHWLWSGEHSLRSAPDFSLYRVRDSIPFPSATFRRWLSSGALGRSIGPYRNVPAVDFDGASFLVSDAQDDRWSLQTSSLITLDLWVKVSSTGNVTGTRIVSNAAQFGPGWSLQTAILSGGGWAPRIAMVNTATTWTRTADVTLSFDEWHHITVGFSRITRDAFLWGIDGAQYQNTTAAPTTGTYLDDSVATARVTFGDTNPSYGSSPLTGSIAAPRAHNVNVGIAWHKRMGDFYAATEALPPVVNQWPRSPSVVAEGYAIDSVRAPSLFLPRLDSQDYRQRGPRPGESGWQNNARDVSFSLVEIADVRAHARKRVETPSIGFRLGGSPLILGQSWPTPNRYWALDDPAGTVVSETAESGGLLNGINQNGVAVGSPGRIRGAYTFTSGTDYVSLGPALNPGTNDFACALWFRSTDTSSQRRVVDNRGTGNPVRGWAFRVGSAAGDRRLYFQMDAGAGAFALVSDNIESEKVQLNEWGHVVVSFVNSTGLMSIYWNGSIVQSISYAPFIGQNFDVAVGREGAIGGPNNDTLTQQFVGDVGEVAFWIGSALSASIVSDLYLHGDAGRALL